MYFHIKKFVDSDGHWWGISVVMDNSKFAYINIDMLESLYRWEEHYSKSRIYYYGVPIIK